jgi:hypothetical protein
MSKEMSYNVKKKERKKCLLAKGINWLHARRGE